MYKSVLFLVALVFMMNVGFLDAKTILTNDDFSRVLATTDSYVGDWAKFSGEVKSTHDFSDHLGYIFAVGDEGFLGAMWITSTLSPPLEKNTCYIVEGKIKGTAPLQNQLTGFERDSPHLELSKYNEITCLEAVHPSTHSIQINETVTKGPVQITIHETELANDHIRVFMTIENLSDGSELGINTSNSIIVQDKKQFKYKNLFGVDYDEFDYSTKIPPGIIEEGYYLLDPIEPNEFELRLYISERSMGELGFETRETHEFIFKADFSKQENSVKKSLVDKPRGNVDVASFVDSTKDPQYYLDRYYNEPAYKEWFDENYPDYSSIEEAVGLDGGLDVRQIPKWVKDTMQLYLDGEISDKEMIGALQYLIQEEIIVVTE